MSDIVRSSRREAAASRRGRLLRRRVAAPALAALVGLWAPAASAEILLWSANSNNPQSFTAIGFVDLNGTAAGGTSLTFSTTSANQRVIIFFNATCQVRVNPGDVRVEVLVNPAGSAGEFSAPPVDTIGSFCSLPSSASTPGVFTRGTIVASARPALAGTHTVRVRVTPRSNPGFPTTADVFAVSLTVMR